jgi:hypothetical protein
MTERMKAREVLQQRIDFRFGDYDVASAEELIGTLRESGFAIVPIEPDEKMIEAGAEQMNLGVDHERYETHQEFYARVYRAMLSAAKDEG